MTESWVPYIAFLLITLIGTMAILIIIKASMFAETSVQEVKKSDNLDYQLRKLREVEQQR